MRCSKFFRYHDVYSFNTFFFRPLKKEQKQKQKQKIKKTTHFGKRVTVCYFPLVSSFFVGKCQCAKPLYAKKVKGIHLKQHCVVSTTITGI